MLYSPKPMHIPDGFLSIVISLICWAITVIVLGIAISRTNKSLGEKQVPLMGVMAAFIFAAQMINFPVAGGTSGHLLGGTLAAITLGTVGGHAGDDGCHRGAGTLVPGWRSDRHGRQHSQYGTSHGRGRLWILSICPWQRAKKQS